MGFSFSIDVFGVGMEINACTGDSVQVAMNRYNH